MPILDILHFPDPRLRKVAEPIEQVNDEVRQIVSDMLETMYQAPGIGLAATQVNIHRQIIVIDVSEDKDEPLCLLNPELVSTDGVEEMEEGCLSVPEQYAKVQRADTVTIRFLDTQGQLEELTADGLLAVCIQHEMDHLKGKLFVDYLSPLKRNRIRKKLEKAARLGAPEQAEIL